MNRFRLSVESLETRETPAGLASVTDLVIDSYDPTATSDSFYGTGVYKSMDGGQTWAASDGTSGRVTGVAVDPSDPSAGNQSWGKWEANPAESQAVRPRMFALVDRTQLFPTVEEPGTDVADSGSAAPGSNDSIWIDIDAPAQLADESAGYFNGVVNRISAGARGDSYSGSHALYQDVFIPSAADPADKGLVLKGSKIGGAQTEDVSVRPTILLQRLANPALPDEAAATKSGSVYTITFGGSLVG